MPRRFRLHIPRPYPMTVLLAVSVGIMAMSVWRWHEGDADRGPAFLLLGVVMAYMCVSTLRIHALVLEDQPSDIELPIAAARMKSLQKSLDFLPEETPPGWSPLSSPRGTALWRASAGDVAIAAYVIPYRVGWRLHLTLAHTPDSAQAASPVPDERAAEIFAQFRNVGEFVELEWTPDFIVKHAPAARSWLAMSADAVAEQQKVVPPRAPRVVVDRPLHPHLAAVRRHLPLKLPRGWSAPLAITEVRDGWDSGAWMIEDDEEVAIVMMVSSGGRAKLAVTIFHPDKSEVNEAQAMRILKHFRAVLEFVQTPVEDEGLEGARAYLGEIEAPRSRALLN